MKRLHTLLAALAVTAAANAQIGAPYIHDPSTIAECEGKYYTFGTGGGGLISEDGWTWNSGAERPGGGAAPDIIKIGDLLLLFAFHMHTLYAFCLPINPCLFVFFFEEECLGGIIFRVRALFNHPKDCQ